MDARDRRKLASEAAAEWWVCLHGEDFSRSQREQFVDWLRESPLHVAEMLRIARVNDALGRFAGWMEMATTESQASTDADSNVVPLRSSAPAVPVSRASTKRRLVIGSAAACVAASLLAVWYQISSPWQVIETERGERREIALADGSVLEVSPKTRLRVALFEQRRLVQLERGAALFHVAKNPHRPFIVEANHTLVRAVGTAFGVENRGQGLVVTVSEGKVAVLRDRRLGLSDSDSALMLAGNAQAATTGDAQGGATSELAPVFLTAGQQIAVPPTGHLGTVRKVDSQRELAWATGRLDFRDAEVRAVIERFNLYNRVQLVVADEKLAHRMVSGVFDASDPESFIAFLASVTPMRVLRRDDQTITLLPAGEPDEKVTQQQ